MTRTFRDRIEAGRLLARQLEEFAHRSDAIVLALPRGGVPVGFEVAHALRLPLDILIVRKLGVPGQPELAMGAIASGGALYRNESVIGSMHVTPREVETAIRRESDEVQRRARMYRGSRPPLQLEGKTVILVDDGIATGSTVRAAVRALAASGPAAIVVATPVIAADTARDLESDVSEVVAVLAPVALSAIGQFYTDFRQTTDDEVREILGRCTTEIGCPEPAKPETGKRVWLSGTKRRTEPPELWAWHFRTLIALRDHLQRRRGDRTRDPSDAMEPPSLHGPDLIDELYDRELADALPPDPDEALAEVEAALRRIEEGRYGRCEATGRRIAPAQLRAAPWCRRATGASADPRVRPEPEQFHTAKKR